MTGGTTRTRGIPTVAGTADPGKLDGLWANFGALYRHVRIPVRDLRQCLGERI